MKNHFIFSYVGNKRNEVENIYRSINFDNVEYIIEPFCGSSAISYFISTKDPNKYKYILNDSNENLCKLYNILKSEEATNILNENINKIIDKFNLYTNDTDRKTYYNFVIKNMDNIESYLFLNKYYGMRPGMYPQINRMKQIKKLDLKECPIYNFLQSENVQIFNKNGLDIVKDYKDNENNLLILDPPYMDSYNGFYNGDNQKQVNIYEYLYYNNINNFNSNIYLILENTWIIKMLFESNNIISTYYKKYEISKNQTCHIIITKINI